VIVCKVCGTENEQGAAFCGSCGAFLEWNGAVEEAGAPSGDAPTETVPLSPVPPARPVGASATAASAEAATVAAAAAGPVPAGAIVCPACGTANDPDRTFCRRCATELAPVSAAPAPVPQPRARSGPPMALLGGAAAVVLLVALGALVLLQGRSPTDSATSAPSASGGVALSPTAGTPSGSPAVASASGGSPSPQPSGSSPASPSTAPSPTPQPADLTGEIVFAATKNGNSDVWVWNATDGTRHRLVGGAGDQSDPSWTWDRTAVVYLTAKGLRIVNADGSVPPASDFTHHAADRHAAWAPNGKVIAFASTVGHGQGDTGGDLNIFTRTVGNSPVTRRLTDDPSDDWDPNWSPDGSTIAFATRRTGDAHLFLMRADGSNQRELDLGPGIYDDPSFSPDGQWLAFTRRDAAGALKTLYVVHPDGTGMRRVTNVTVNESDPTWSPDSRLIAVARGGTGSPIAVVDLATGADVASLGINGARNQQPDWR
jgi:hypothetical protein